MRYDGDMRFWAGIALPETVSARHILVQRTFP